MEDYVDSWIADLQKNKHTDIDYEPYALSKFPKKGKCKYSPFANGYHRAGTIPIESVLDGGAPGDIARDICLHCGRRFKQTWFVLKKQPREIKPTN